MYNQQEIEYGSIKVQFYWGRWWHQPREGMGYAIMAQSPKDRTIQSCNPTAEGVLGFCSVSSLALSVIKLWPQKCLQWDRQQDRWYNGSFRDIPMISPWYPHVFPTTSLFGAPVSQSRFQPRTAGAPCGVAGGLPSPTSRLACSATPRLEPPWPCPRRAPWQVLRPSSVCFLWTLLRFFCAKVKEIEAIIRFVKHIYCETSILATKRTKSIDERRSLSQFNARFMERQPPRPSAQNRSHEFVSWASNWIATHFWVRNVALFLGVAKHKQKLLNIGSKDADVGTCASANASWQPHMCNDTVYCKFIYIYTRIRIYYVYIYIYIYICIFTYISLFTFF